MPRLTKREIIRTDTSLKDMLNQHEEDIKQNETLMNENKRLINENKTLIDENKTLIGENKTLINQHDEYIKEMTKPDPILNSVSGRALDNVSVGLDLGRFTDCWGYTSPNGNKYALMNRKGSFVIYSLANEKLDLVESIPINPSGWADVKVYQDYCYVVTESNLPPNQGITIISLVNIDNGVKPTIYKTINKVDLGNNMMLSINALHNVYIDTENGMLYACGVNSSWNSIYTVDEREEEVGIKLPDGVHRLKWDTSDPNYMWSLDEYDIVVEGDSLTPVRESWNENNYFEYQWNEENGIYIWMRNDMAYQLKIKYLENGVYHICDEMKARGTVTVDLESSLEPGVESASITIKSSETRENPEITNDPISKRFGYLKKRLPEVEKKREHPDPAEVSRFRGYTAKFTLKRIEGLDFTKDASACCPVYIKNSPPDENHTHSIQMRDQVYNPDMVYYHDFVAYTYHVHGIRKVVGYGSQEFYGIDVIDITDITNWKLIAKLEEHKQYISESYYEYTAEQLEGWGYTGGLGYMHQIDPSSDGRYIFANDEFMKMNCAIVYDVLPTIQTLLEKEPSRPLLVTFTGENMLQNPVDEPQLTEGLWTNGTESGRNHNMYVHYLEKYKCDVITFSCYGQGLRVIKLIRDDDKIDLKEIGYFDTYPDGDNEEFVGQWSNYYFNDDDNLCLASDIQYGHFLIKMEWKE